MRSGAGESEVRTRAFNALPQLVRAAEAQAPAGAADVLAFLQAQTGGAHAALALRALAGAHQARGRHAEALAAAEALLALNGAGAEHVAAAHAARVLALADLGRSTEAAAALTAAEQAVPESSEGYTTVASAGLDLAYRMADDESTTRAAGAADPYAPVRERAEQYAAALSAMGQAKTARPSLVETQHAETARTSAAPVAFAVATPYPNPVGAAGALTLPVALPEAAEVRVAVYDALGRLVLRASHRYDFGEHAVLLEASGLAPGAYVARVVAGEASGTVRFAVTR